MGYLLAEPRDYELLMTYIERLDVEFSKYPKVFHQRVQLRTIAIVKYLNVSTRGGVFKQSRSAYPDALNHTLYYDFKAGRFDPDYQTNVMHHEYFHLIDYQLNGFQFYWRDPQWMGFNNPNFTYGNGGTWNRGGDYTKRLNYPLKGFISSYSTTGVEEDKACIFAALMIESSHRIVNTWAKTDSILKQKIQYIKQFVGDKEGGLEIN
ncbi:hypothetical protein [Marinicella meishanensis]|uniref:hypothetical protein n=1 Tax=Marinicella meishanensis TaxID=2873263 RepID=UPI001CBF0810|nr:hypothetical protein [Marinicella sp. NBU2979]